MGLGDIIHRAPSSLVKLQYLAVVMFGVTLPSNYKVVVVGVVNSIRRDRHTHSRNLSQESTSGAHEQSLANT